MITAAQLGALPALTDTPGITQRQPAPALRRRESGITCWEP
ncbi:hypothetical protein ABZ642_40215 [Streptomyces sp. NPDC007157]